MNNTHFSLCQQVLEKNEVQDFYLKYMLFLFFAILCPLAMLLSGKITGKILFSLSANANGMLFSDSKIVTLISAWITCTRNKTCEM